MEKKLSGEKAAKTAKEVRGIPFKEGDDPRRNLNGRPAGVRNFTTKVREAMEKIADGKEYTYEEAFVKSILHKAIIEKDPTIMRLIWNYFDGMPKGTLDLGASDELKDFLTKLNKVLDD